MAINQRAEPRVEKELFTQHSSSNAITANEINTQSKNSIRIVPGNNNTLALRSMIKKTCIVGDRHIRRTEKNLFNNSINEGKAHLNSFS